MATAPGAQRGGIWSSGESLAACAIRAAREETGIDVADVRFLAITHDVFPDGKHNVTIGMEGTYVAGDAAIGEPEKVSEVAWFAWDACRSRGSCPLRTCWPNGVMLRLTSRAGVPC